MVNGLYIIVRIVASSIYIQLVPSSVINGDYDFQVDQNQGVGRQERPGGHSDPVQRRV